VQTSVKDDHTFHLLLTSRQLQCIFTIDKWCHENYHALATNALATNAVVTVLNRVKKLLHQDPEYSQNVNYSFLTQGLNLPKIS